MADALAFETLPLDTSHDVVRARQRVRDIAVEMGYSLVDQTKLVTAASELARNTIDHGRGGDMTVERVASPSATGIRLVFTDHGPGIADVELALRDGYTTGGGLGMGLGGARRLVSEMAINSTPGAGTRITVTKWKRA